MPTLRAEFRKLLTIRSTYGISILGLAVTAGLSFYLAGWYARPEDLRDPRFLADQVASPLGIVAVLGTLVGILVMTHEYRYKTVAYTLVSARSRGAVLLAKFVVVTAFALGLTIAVDGASMLASDLGARVAHGDALVSQTLGIGDLLWRTVLFGWGYAVAGLVIATLIRNQVGAIVTAFLLFGPIEGILDAILGSRAVYLPFTALGNVLRSKTVNTILLPVSPGRAAMTFAVDIAIGSAIAWTLFVRRDVGS